MEELKSTEMESLEPPKDRLDFNTFKDKLGLWADSFKPFIESKEMYDIMNKVREDAAFERIVPESKNTFRAFLTTDPKNVKVIFYLMDPYPKRYRAGLYQATGIAMDCSNAPNGKLQPSLEIFYDGIDRELGTKVERSASLEYLHEQGCMMLNTDLTCKLNKTASHAKLWEPFQKFFLEEVMGSRNEVIYVLCGVSSKRMERYINPFCNIFKIEHPVAAGRMGVDWETKGVFKTINKILKDNNNWQILWDKKEWEDSKPPF